MDKGYVTAQAGAVGMILANDKEDGDGLEANAHFLLPIQTTLYGEFLHPRL